MTPADPGTARIRWEDTGTGEALGYVGTLGRAMFRIWPPEAGGEWMVTSYLHVSQRGRHGQDAAGAKAEAERWLAEFVTSLGAIFPEVEYEFEELSEERFRAAHAPGRRVRFSRPDAGWPGDQEMAAERLTPGEVYTIAWSDVGFSSTNLGLEGVESGLGFNSVLFEPVPDEPATEPGR